MTGDELHLEFGQLALMADVCADASDLITALLDDRPIAELLRNVITNLYDIDRISPDYTVAKFTELASVLDEVHWDHARVEGKRLILTCELSEESGAQ